MSNFQFDARMDPWCVVDCPDGNRILFGFAEQHRVTRGLSWVRSSEIVALLKNPWRAVTATGTHYSLGRQVNASDLEREGEEACVAFSILVKGTGTIIDHVDVMWLTACKMARHLGLVPPSRDHNPIAIFLALHSDEYSKRSAEKFRQ